MDDRSMRIEWRTSPEHARAAAALLQRRAARRTLGWAIAWSTLALSALLVDSWCARLGLALPFGLLAYASFAIARRRTTPLDRAQIRAWIAEAQSRRADTFRDPASVAGGPTAYLLLDARGVEVGGSGFEHVRLRWSALRGVRALSGGHVFFVGRDALGVIVPAWAFEADEQREALIAQARAWLAGAPVHEPAQHEPPPLPPSETVLELTAPARFELFRRMRASTSAGGYLLWALFTWVLGCGLTMAALEWTGGDASLPALLESPLRFVPYTLVAAALALRTTTAQALLALPRLRRHGVHRVRLSEHGFAWSTALWSGASSWTTAPLTLTPHAVMLGGLALPRAAFSAAQLEWLEARAPAPAGAPSKSAWRSIAVTLALLAIGFAIHQLVVSDPEAVPAPITDDTTRLAPLELAPSVSPERSCELPSASFPAPPLAHDSAQCADLVVPESARIEHCAALGDDRADRIAVVAGPWRRLRLWLHSGGRWRDAGVIMEWNHQTSRVELASVSVLDRQGSPRELLITVERHSGDRSRNRTHRWVARAVRACSLRDGRTECAHLLDIAKMTAWWRDYPAEELYCERAWYDAEWVGERLAITHRAEVLADPFDELDADRDWGGPPDGSYSLDELARWWDRR